MPKKKYTAEFKSKVILTIIQGDKELNPICADFNLNLSMLRKWKQELLQNAHLKRKNDQMLKTIGQLRLERDFLQGCFRQIGEAVPSLPDYDSKEL